MGRPSTAPGPSLAPQMGGGAAPVIAGVKSLSFIRLWKQKDRAWRTTWPHLAASRTIRWADGPYIRRDGLGVLGRSVALSIGRGGADPRVCRFIVGAPRGSLGHTAAYSTATSRRSIWRGSSLRSVRPRRCGRAGSTGSGTSPGRSSCASSSGTCCVCVVPTRLAYSHGPARFGAGLASGVAYASSLDPHVAGAGIPCADFSGLAWPSPQSAERRSRSLGASCDPDAPVGGGRVGCSVTIAVVMARTAAYRPAGCRGGIRWRSRVPCGGRLAEDGTPFFALTFVTRAGMSALCS